MTNTVSQPSVSVILTTSRKDRANSTAKVCKTRSHFHRGHRVGLEPLLERNNRLDLSSVVLARRLLPKAISSLRRKLQMVPALRIKLSKANNKDLAGAREASQAPVWDLVPSSNNKARANRLREDTSLIGTRNNRLRQLDRMVIPTSLITGNILNTGSRRD